MKKCGEKEKGTVQGRTDRKRPILNPSTCILHENFLSFVGISLTKHMERKKNEQIQRGIHDRRPFHNPTI